MVSCNDCLHIDVCETRTCYMCDGGGFKCDDCEIYSNYGGKIPSIKNCKYFKDRTRFVELPCKVGDTVYYITGLSRKYIKSAIVNEIVINCNGISELFVSNDTVNFENSFDIFYLTREEAEQALKEREKNG